jgi:hypothetical protein
MRANSQPRSIAGLSIAPSGLLPGLRADRQEFMLEGAIDPRNIQARRDPMASLPNSYAEGAIGFEYQLRPSQMSESNTVDLMKRARQSYYNHVNMFQPPNVATSDVNIMSAMRARTPAT